MRYEIVVRTQIAVFLAFAAALCGGCGQLKSWKGSTILVQYSWDPTTQTRITQMDDLSSGKPVADRRLARAITQQANQDLPVWIRLEKLTRATGVFHAHVSQSGAIEISETMHGVDGVSRDFVKDPDITPEMYAAQAGDLEKVKKLIREGGPVNAQDQRGNTALMAAVSSHNVEVLRFLLEHGADVNARNKEGDTALTLSVASGQMEIVEELAEHGAVLNCGNAVDRFTLSLGMKRQPRLRHVLEKLAVNCRVPSPHQGQ